MQFSLFGAGVAEPTLDDLDGVLLGGGQWARIGATARLSVVVTDRWRAAALAEAFAERGVTAGAVTPAHAAARTTPAHSGAGAGPPVGAAAGAGGAGSGASAVQAAQQGFVARTAFSAALYPHAARWTRGANQSAPPGLVLSAAALRLWAIAAGRHDGTGYLISTAVTGMSTAVAGNSTHRIAGAQLARLGLAAVSLTQSPGPGWRVTSAKRLRRLAELLGEPPDGAGPDWPS